jgi:hypothetical protein
MRVFVDRAQLGHLARHHNWGTSHSIHRGIPLELEGRISSHTSNKSVLHGGMQNPQGLMVTCEGYSAGTMAN